MLAGSSFRISFESLLAFVLGAAALTTGTAPEAPGTLASVTALRVDNVTFLVVTAERVLRYLDRSEAEESVVDCRLTGPLREEMESDRTSRIVDAFCSVMERGEAA